MRYLFSLLFLTGIAFAQNPIHVTYLWHMHQPIYYPRLSVPATDSSGLFNFSVQGVHDNRSGPYTSWPRNAVQQGADRNMAHAGVQVSFSGSLMENLNGIWNLNWRDNYRHARNVLRTSHNNPRLDLVGFAYHHSLMPLTSRESMRMQIRLHREAYVNNWNTGGSYSKGFFPPESSFALHMIPALVQEGIEWVLVDNGHIDRTLQDFPWSSASSIRPNRADQRNGPISRWNSQWTQLNNVWAPTQVAAPFSYQPRRMRYVDPWSDPGNPTVYSMIAVPAGRYEGNENARGGYGAFKPENVWGPVSDRNNNANRPMLLVCHSDGDNFGMLNSDAYHAQHGFFLDMVQSDSRFDHTTVQDYLEMYPVPSNDPYIHVEPGSWIGIDGGTPFFYKWLEDNAVNGEHPDHWNWSVLMSALNRVLHAESRENTYSMNDVRWGIGPDTAKSWYHYLNAEASDYWYWDFDRTNPWDGNVTRAANMAITEANKVIARHPGVDTIGPSIFHPQRTIWNPGGKHWNETTNQPSDFAVWTFVDDVSGVANVSLYWRIADWDWYTNLNDFAQEIYAHTPGKNSAWNIVPMTGAWYPTVKGPLVPDPLNRAMRYTGSITGQSQNLISYFVQAVDNAGNTNRSDIFHVWVGEVTGGGGPTNGCSGRVCVSPVPPVAGNTATITYTAAGGPIAGASQVRIHLGWNNWNTVVSPDPAMTAVSNTWEYVVTVPANATQLDCVFNNGAGTWDNNGGADWHFAVTGTPQPPATPGNLAATAVATNQINLTWSASVGATGYILQRGGVPIATTSGTSYNDISLSHSTEYCYSVAATNAIGGSLFSLPACATTPAPSTALPFELTGNVSNYPGYLITSPGMTLYAAVRGTKLYVATWSPGSSGGANDHFILVSDQLLGSASAGAPWAKAGNVAVAGTKPFIGGESANSFVGWFNAPGGSPVAKAATSAGTMEGVIDLVAAFGAMPATVYLAATAYATADGGALTAQAPAGNGDGNIDPSEFLALPVSALMDSDSDGVLDRLDPGKDFVIHNVQPAGGGGFTVTWAAVPGKTYQVMYCDAFGAGWQNLPGAQYTAAGGQLTLSHTDNTAGAQRFYKVQLIP